MIKAITGTKDILPIDMPKWKYLESIVNKTMQNFNYKEIRTPVFEETALFSRGIGEATDIVSKEMYTFLDRSETSVTLKPEMTAAVVRALIEHSLDKKQSLNKLFYISPMFRQEKPQAGRLRQFHQFGAEALGFDSPVLDAEMIILPYQILKQLGLNHLSVKINSLGVPASRENYKLKLREYLSDKFTHLSEESKKRFDINILRIFDSKDEGDQRIMKDAPLLLDYLDEESLKHFETVKSILDSAQIPYEIDARLVRGLDYYTNTTFEVISGSVGSQSALCGGGRYNLLAQEIGGSAIPGVGFAAGIERILLACANENTLSLPEEKIELYVVLLDKTLSSEAYSLSLKFRNAGLAADFDYAGRSVKAQMREANKYNAGFVLFFGGDEYKEGLAVLKNMADGTETKIAANDIDKIIATIKGV
jgi:histidyl-tRNA synthetase